jgi:hypothetical protein
MLKFRLLWEFSNGHLWHKDYDTMSELETGLLSMGLYNNPQVVSIKIEEVSIN